MFFDINISKTKGFKYLFREDFLIIIPFVYKCGSTIIEKLIYVLKVIGWGALSM
jgi:hypothetical protein